MKKIITVGCTTDGSVNTIELTQSIHERKAAGTCSSVRKQTDEVIATILLKGNPPDGLVVRKHTSKYRRTIRVAFGKQFITENGQRFIRILMWVKSMVINLAGELTERRHKFRLNYPIPSAMASA